MKLVEAQQVVAGYGHRAVLCNLSFYIEKPCFFAIVGHNGSGKTTLFKLLSGVLPYNGSLTISGKEVADIQQFARKVAILEQKNNIHFAVNVLDLVLAGSFSQKTFWENYTPKDRQKAQAILSKLNITHLAAKDFAELSGGEQQMVWLAQLMMQDTDICLLDEPTQHLDLYNRRRVFDLMKLWVDSGKTVICITHDLQYLEQMQGLMFNLSAQHEGVMAINHENLQRQIACLEKENSNTSVL